MNKLRIKLAVKILSLVTVLLLVSNLSLGLGSLRVSEKNLKALSDQALIQVGQSVSDQINDFINTEFTLLNALANIDLMKSDDYTTREKCDQLISIAKVDPAKYENVAYYDASGNTFKADGSTMSLATSAYFKASIQGKNYVTAPALNVHTNSVLMFFSVPVYNYDGKITGVMCSVLKGNPIEDIVKRSEITGGLKPVVLSLADNSIIADVNADDSKIEGLYEEADPSSDIGKIFNSTLKGETNTGVFFNPKMGKKITCSYVPLDKNNAKGSITPWTVFCAAPYDVYFSQLNTLKNTILISLIVFIILGIVLGSIAIRVIIKPILEVKESINEISTGNADLTKRIDQHTNDEVGDVVQSFNKFTEKLQQIVSDIKESKNNLTLAGSELDSSSTNTEISINQILDKLNKVIPQIQGQNNSVTETAGAVNEIASNIESLDKMIETQSHGIMDASSAVEQMVGNINSVTASMDKMAESFNELSRQATNGEKLQMNI